MCRHSFGEKVPMEGETSRSVGEILLTFHLQWNFFETMTSQTESSICMEHTPLYENEQKERKNI